MSHGQSSLFYARLKQVYYHLGELDSALTFALGAGALFDVTEHTEFSDTVVGACWWLLASEPLQRLPLH